MNPGIILTHFFEINGSFYGQIVVWTTFTKSEIVKIKYSIVECKQPVIGVEISPLALVQSPLNDGIEEGILGIEI